jgi:hypothetical protein
MDTIGRLRSIVVKKPLFFVLITAVYFVSISFIKWQLKPDMNTLMLLAGAAAGLYLIDAAEAFVNINPSPFRGIIFTAGFIFVSFFVVSSSGSYLGTGLVLSMFITMLLWQIGELKITSSLNDWYRTAEGPLPKKNQYLMLAIFIGAFILETLLFVRQFPT